MVKRRAKFTFPPELIKEPIMYKLGQRFEGVTDIRRVDVDGDEGGVVVELRGSGEDTERGIAWVNGKGVRADPVTGDIAEG